MNSQTNLQLAHQLLARMGSNASAEDMAALCVADLDWHVPGDSGAFPWIGKQSGAHAMADFVAFAQALISREKLDLKDILASDSRAVIVGELQSRVNATGKLIDSHFAIVLTFADDKVASFLMLEDSYAVALAARA